MRFWNYIAPTLIIAADEIAFSSADALLAEVASAPSIELALDCNGGDMRTAFQIFDGLRGRVSHATITGRCVSAALIIALCADRISIFENGRIVLHPPTISAYGRKSQIDLAAQVLGEVTERCVRTVSERRGIKRKAVDLWYRDGRDFVFNANEALNAGLVDEIIPAPPEALRQLPSLETFPIGPRDDGKASLLLELLQAIGTIKTADPTKLRAALYTWQRSNIESA